MTYMALWLGGLTGAAFCWGVGAGLWLYPPVTWVTVGGRRPAASENSRGGAARPLSPERRVNHEDTKLTKIAKITQKNPGKPSACRQAVPGFRSACG